MSQTNYFKEFDTGLTELVEKHHLIEQYAGSKLPNGPEIVRVDVRQTIKRQVRLTDALLKNNEVIDTNIRDALKSMTNNYAANTRNAIEYKLRIFDINKQINQLDETILKDEDTQNMSEQMRGARQKIINTQRQIAESSRIDYIAKKEKLCLQAKPALYQENILNELISLMNNMLVSNSQIYAGINKIKRKYSILLETIKIVPDKGYCEELLRGGIKRISNIIEALGFAQSKFCSESRRISMDIIQSDVVFNPFYNLIRQIEPKQNGKAEVDAGLLVND